MLEHDFQEYDFIDLNGKIYLMNTQYSLLRIPKEYNIYKEIIANMLGVDSDSSISLDEVLKLLSTVEIQPDTP